jgi:chloramphenicol-sensitive protein RarD
MAANPEDHTRHEHRLGLAYGFSAYLVWGFFPVYLKALAGAPVEEVLSHRVVWAFVFLLGVAAFTGRLAAVRAALVNRRALTVLAASTVLIAINWGVYIYSVMSGRMLESSLGYYLNPLVNVLLGVVILGERLETPVRWATALAALGVASMAASLGHLPWISVSLAISFGTYGLLRKIAPVGALTGLFVETLLLLPFLAGFLIARAAAGEGVFLAGNGTLDLLLLLSGPATAVPLLCFAAAARRLPLSTLGFLQYLSPTIQFLLAVLVYREPFDRARLGAFVLIWAAVAVFAIHTARRKRAEPVIDAG